MKYCKNCDTNKLLTDFYRNKSRYDGLSSSCKACTKVKTNNRYSSRPEEHRSRKRKSYINNIVTERERSAKKRSSRLLRVPLWFSEWDEFLYSVMVEEAISLEKLTGYKWHVDHILPLQGELVSGLHIANNFQLLPATVNLKKSNTYHP